jgi:DNA-binding MarR family transcriptional regulator
MEQENNFTPKNGYLFLAIIFIPLGLIVGLAFALDLGWIFTLDDLVFLLNRSKASLNTTLNRLEKKNWIVIDRVKGYGFSKKVIKVTDKFPDTVSLERLETADKFLTDEYTKTKERLKEWIVNLDPDLICTYFPVSTDRILDLTFDFEDRIKGLTRILENNGCHFAAHTLRTASRQRFH